MAMAPAAGSCVVRLLCLAAAVAGHGNSHGLQPVQLSAHEDVGERLQDHGTALRANGSSQYPDPAAAGSLTCMRWTGGNCRIFACKEERGFVSCEDGYCMCQPGTCADSEGKCIPNFEGKWIGEYSIRFSNAWKPERPFLGLDEEGGVPYVGGGLAWPAAVSTSDKLWKLAQTPNGRVRLSSTKEPGSVLTIYNNRRRRSDFLQEKAQLKRKTKGDSDLWPVLVKLEAATPLAATFQVRPTMQDGGGYELWDPQNNVALASADPEAWGHDSVGKRGVSECYMESTFWGDPCKGGRQLIEFDPELPHAARLELTRAHIEAITLLAWWQTLLFFCCICGCAICCAQYDEGRPPLIFEVASSAQSAKRDRDRRLEEDAAEQKRERQAFAEKIAGVWVFASDIGNFDYEFRNTPEGVSVHGRSQGASEWDSTFTASIALPGQVSWKDDAGTKFIITFADDTTVSECGGTACAQDGQVVSFEGKRTEPAP